MRRFGEWLKRFGPGAILASLTIGVGELVFSTRAGALFEYKLLWLFALVLFLKWAFAFATARHFVLTGVHPFQRWMELPGPRGWFSAFFGVIAILSFPIWVAFHSGTMGTLVAALTGTTGAHLWWGMAILGVVTVLCFVGGYKTLERAQVVIVAVMLGAVLVAFFMLRPDWDAVMAGLVPQAVAYPDWAATIPELKGRPVWIETVTYVGVIGGSGYDYLAYVSYLREKDWRGEEGVRTVFWDSVVSFAAVLVFTVVFTACGAMLLHPQKAIPTGSDLLTLQAQIVTAVYPGLKYLYFVGAALAVFGTLYGTVEVAPAIAREIGLGFGKRPERKWAIGWVCAGGFVALLAMMGYRTALVAMLTPANLFTGVLACGCIAWLSVWADFKWLPKAQRMPHWLVIANVLGGLIFLALGVRSFFS